MKTIQLGLLWMLFLVSFTGVSQEHETILAAPTDWISEIIPFPLRFAPEIDLVGYEDLRFAPNWNKPEHDEFWTYMFVWYVTNDKKITKDKLTMYFNSYYDGLMNVKFQDIDATETTFETTNNGFKGKMKVYDNFFTKDYMTLNIRVAVIDCPETEKQLIRCELSPQDFSHELWNALSSIKVLLACEHN